MAENQLIDIPEGFELIGGYAPEGKDAEPAALPEGFESIGGDAGANPQGKVASSEGMSAEGPPSKEERDQAVRLARELAIPGIGPAVALADRLITGDASLGTVIKDSAKAFASGVGRVPEMAKNTLSAIKRDLSYKPSRLAAEAAIPVVGPALTAIDAVAPNETAAKALESLSRPAERALGAASDFVEKQKKKRPDLFTLSDQYKKAKWYEPERFIPAGMESAGTMGATFLAGPAAPETAAILFWGDTAKQAFDKADKEHPEWSEGRKQLYANTQGGIEGLLEMLETRMLLRPILGKIPLGVKKDLVKAAAGAVEKPALEFAKSFAKTQMAESAFEAGQDYLEQWNDYLHFGYWTDHSGRKRTDMPSIIEAAKVVPATLVMGTALGAAPALGGVARRQKILADLEGENVDHKDRLAAANAVYEAVKEEDPELAEMWVELVTDQLVKNKPVVLLTDSAVRRQFADLKRKLQEQGEWNSAYDQYWPDVPEQQIPVEPRLRSTVEDGEDGVLRVSYYRPEDGRLVGEARILDGAIGSVEVEKNERRKGYGLEILRDLIQNYGGRTAYAGSAEGASLLRAAGMEEVSPGRFALPEGPASGDNSGPGGFAAHAGVKGGRPITMSTETAMDGLEDAVAGNINRTRRAIRRPAEGGVYVSPADAARPAIVKYTRAYPSKARAERALLDAYQKGTIDAGSGRVVPYGDRWRIEVGGGEGVIPVPELTELGEKRFISPATAEAAIKRAAKSGVDVSGWIAVPDGKGKWKAAKLSQGELEKRNRIPEDLRPAIEIMKQQVANGQAGGVKLDHETGEVYRHISTFPDWFKRKSDVPGLEGGWSVSGFNRLVRKLERGYPLTEKQADMADELYRAARHVRDTHPDLVVGDDIDYYSKRGYELAGEKKVAGDLGAGQRIVARLPGDAELNEYTVKGRDGDSVVFEGEGRTVKIPAGDEITVDMVARGSDAGADARRTVAEPELSGADTRQQEPSSDVGKEVSASGQSADTARTVADTGKASSVEKTPPQDRRKDIARRKRVDEMTEEERIRALYTNETTGIKNKRAFLDAEDLDREQGKTPKEKVFFDVDSLKYINDAAGHAAGDALLRESEGKRAPRGEKPPGLHRAGETEGGESERKSEAGVDNSPRGDNDNGSRRLTPAAEGGEKEADDADRKPALLFAATEKKNHDDKVRDHSEGLPPGEQGGDVQPSQEERGSGGVLRDEGKTSPGDQKADGELRDDGSRGGGSGHQPAVRLVDYRITPADNLGRGGQKTKFKDNIAAIRVLKELRETGRAATPEDQAALVKYVGWGGIPQAFFRSDGTVAKGWEKEAKELKSLLTKEEYEAARATTQDAHYTSHAIISAIYKGLARLGFTGGRVLEPAVGTGNFIGLMPQEIKAASKITGVEIDGLTAEIAKHLYPQQRIVNTGFQDFVISPDSFDLAVGNPPFGSKTLHDHNHKVLSRFSIHNFFFAKSLIGLRPGGILAMVVSSHMMDKKGGLQRAWISKRAELLGAVRLPNNAFKGNANTEVTTDVIFLRKLADGESPAGHKWQGLKEVVGPDGVRYTVNEYFADHPDMMLGDVGPNKLFPGEVKGGAYEGVPGLLPREGLDMDAAMTKALQALPEGIFQRVEPTEEAQTAEAVVSDPGFAKPYGYAIDDNGRVVRRLPDVNGEQRYEPVTYGGKPVTGKRLERYKGLLRIRDAVRKLIRAEIEDDSRIERYRKELNRVYDRFVEEHGYISAKANASLMEDDPTDFPLLRSLEEDFDPGISRIQARRTGEKPRPASAKKAAIFTVRSREPYRPAAKAETPREGLAIVLREEGRVNIPRIVELTGKTEAEVLGDLRGMVFLNPDSGEFESREKYLSGNVRRKLEAARRAAEQDPEFKENVKALEEVQPENVPPEKISFKIGATWIPGDVYSQFSEDVLGGRLVVRHHHNIGSWTVVGGEGNASEYDTPGMAAVEIFERLLKGKDLTVYNKPASKDEPRTVNRELTAAAQQKGEEIGRAFHDWVLENVDVADRLAKIFNEKVNTNVDPVFDGSHMIFPGMGIITAGVRRDDQLRPHQKNVAWRMIQKGKGLFDHVVGSGKTFAAIATGMEMRRMGLVNKPMYVVPNHLVKQWAVDFQKLYPGGNVLVIGKKDFTAKKRREFMARIATGNWDAVVMAHSSFGFINAPRDYLAKFLAAQVDEYDKAIDAMRAAEGKKSRTVKQAEKARDRIKEKLKALKDRSTDDVVDFSELGVDALFVDEAHEFKNLFYATSHSRVSGLGNPAGSKKAFDLFVKTQYILDHNNDKGVFFLTGTPVSNTIAEMYTMMRYLDYGRLKEMGISHFDQWASMFADLSSDWEVDPTGTRYRLQTSFRGFINVPGMMGIYRDFADVISQEDLKRMAKERGQTWPIPDVKGGKPTLVVAERTEDQADFMDWIIHRMDNMPSDPSLDNPLAATGDAMKAALDMRLIDPSLPDHPGTKVNLAVDRIVKTYRKWDAQKGTQLVFCDLSVPKKAAGRQAEEIRAAEEEVRRREVKLEDESMPPEKRMAVEQEYAKAVAALEKFSYADRIAARSSFSVYDDIKAKLAAAGIPENEIAFIHDANTDLQKEDLFAKVRAGQVRVLIGSTAKMGAGMNVQERLVALHHLDAPWRPSDLEQREGRIIRQGNKLFEDALEKGRKFEVEIFRYATKETLDTRRWQVIERKAKVVAQLRSATQKWGEAIEDAAGEAVSAAEMKAASSGNPLILKEVQLRKRIDNLEVKRRAWQAQTMAHRRAIKDAEAINSNYADYVSEVKNDVTRLKKSDDGRFSITIDGKKYAAEDDTKKAAEKVKPRVSRALMEAMASGQETEIEYKGMPILLRSGFSGSMVFRTILDSSDVYAWAKVTDGKITYTRNDKFSLNGFLVRLNNLRDKIIAGEGDVLRYLDSWKERANQKAEIARQKIGDGFDGEEELEQARKEHAAILEELKSGTGPEGQQEKKDFSRWERLRKSQGAGGAGTTAAKLRLKAISLVGRAGIENLKINIVQSVDELKREIGKSGALFSVADRRTSPGKYPDSLATVAKHTNIQTLRRHPGFDAAKNHGDTKAALDVVSSVIKGGVLDEIATAIPRNEKRVAIVPVLQREGDSGNAIPMAYAIRLETLLRENGLDATVHRGIVKNKGDHNTDAPADVRARNTQDFDGELPPGDPYIIVVDDTFTTGSTLSALIDHITIRGGRVGIATTLASGRYQNWLKPSPAKIRAMLDKAGIDRVTFEHELGYPPEHLTGSEIQAYIVNGGKGPEGLLRRFPPRRVRGDVQSGEGSGESKTSRAPQIFHSKTGAIEGAFDPTTGKIYLVADNIPLNEAWGKILHEATHKARHEGGWAAVFGKRHAAIMAAIERKLAKGDEAWKAAERKAIDAKTPSHLIREETITYFLADHANRKQVLWRRIANAIRAWAVNVGIKRKITDADIVALAEHHIQRAARQKKQKAVWLTGDVVSTPSFSHTASLWHSRLRRAIAEKFPNRAPSREMLRTLEQWKKKGTLPKPVQEELEWSGLEEWLEGQGGKVSRDDVLAFLDENGVKVEEVVKEKRFVISNTAGESEYFDNYDEAQQRLDEENDWIDEEAAAVNTNRDEGYITVSNHETTLWNYEKNEDGEWEKTYEYTPNQIEEVFDSYADALEDAEYEAEKIRDSYRDELSAEPEIAEDDVIATKFHNGAIPGTQTELPGGENYRELLITLPVDASKQYDKIAIEEFSDKYEDLSEENQMLVRGMARSRLEETGAGSFQSSHFNELNILVHVRFNERTDTDGKRVLFVEEVQSDWHQEGRRKGYGDGVPDAPFKTSWSMLAMKRMIRWAAENGFDRIAWTTGEQQAERYDLSKQVSKVVYDRHPSFPERGRLIAYDRYGNTVIDKHDVPEDKLEDYIGKDPAKKLLESESGVISGLDLKVGGEGMRAFYDKMLPKEVQRFIRKLDKSAKVEVAEVDENTGPVHAFDITDKIRESALAHGMPLFSVKSPRQASLFDNDFSVPEDNSLWDAFLYHIQDKMRPLLKVQEAIRGAGGRINEAADAYLQEELYHGKAAHAIEKFQDEEVQPLLDEMARLDVSVEELDEYLYARHAKEANAVLKSRNPDRKDNDALSGMTNSEADRILKAARPELADLARRVYGIIDGTLDVLEKNGLEKEETIRVWRNQYRYYVPLHREGKARKMPVRGMGYSVKGSSSAIRAGSHRRAVNILAHIIAKREATLIRAEKVKVGRSLLLLALQNKNDDFWKVDTPEMKPSINEDGIVEYHIDPVYKNADNVLVVRLRGVDHTITFNDENPHAMRLVAAMKNLNSNDVGWIVKVLSRVNRWLGAVNTQYNPVFALTNFFRDIQTAAFNLGDTELQDMRAKVLADVPKAFAGLRRYHKGKGGEWARYAEEFKAAGGATGWVEAYTEIEDREKKVRWQLAMAGNSGKAITLRAGKAVLDFVAAENEAVENAVRLSAYVNARRKGLSRAKAASLAKNLTVNFNRRGSATPILNSLYLFFNANVQGIARLLKAASRSRKVQRMMASVFLFAVLQDIVNRIIGGVDDDGVPNYDKIPTFVKDRNIIFMLPDGGKITIPLPWGYNILQTLAQVLAESVDPNYAGGKTALDRAARVVSAIMDAFNPMGSAPTLNQFLAPTIADPAIQIAENKDFAGRKIRPEQNPFGPPRPESQLYWRTTGELSKAVARRLNELTGGTAERPGFIDISPEVFEYVWGVATGGLGKLASNMAHVAGKLAKDDLDIPPYRVPLARRFYRGKEERWTADAYYKALTDVEYTRREWRRAIRERNKVGIRKARRSPNYRLIALARETQRRIKTIKEKRDRIEAAKRRNQSARVRLADKRIDAVMKSFLRRYNEAHQTAQQ